MEEDVKFTLSTRETLRL